VIFLAEVMGVRGVGSLADLGVTTLDVASQDTDSDVTRPWRHADFLDYK
jgi:hypothetical protein